MPFALQTFFPFQFWISFQILETCGKVNLPFPHLQVPTNNLRSMQNNDLSVFPCPLKALFQGSNCPSDYLFLKVRLILV
jgi:hypothetical protein